MDRRNVTDLLLAKVEPRLHPATGPGEADTQPGPAQLAAEGFPVPLAEGLAGHQPTAAPGSRPADPAGTQHRRR